MVGRHKTLEIVIQEICQNFPDVIAIYLFGSFATLYETSQSDVDIAILAKNAINNIKRFYLAERIASKINRDVDLIDLKKANTLLKFQIISRGELIYCKDKNMSERYADQSFAEYQLFNETQYELIQALCNDENIIKGA